MISGSPRGGAEASQKWVAFFVMYYIYILKSLPAEKYYIGYSLDPWKRLFEHNNDPRNTFTSKYRPWDLKAVFQVSPTEKDAMAIEKFNKSQKSLLKK